MIFPYKECGSRRLRTTSFGLGAAGLGRVIDGIPDGDEIGARTLENAYEAGLRHVDTSPAYGDSERRLGIALRRNEFPDLTISTKVGTHPARRGSYSRNDIRWSLSNSLNLLARTHVDIALIHDPPSMDPVLEHGAGFDALCELRDEGVCGNVGLGVRRHEFHYAAIGTGKVDVILTYADYNIIRRSALSLMKAAYEAGVGILLGSPHMGGFLAGEKEPILEAEANPKLSKWYSPSDARAAQAWWEWCRERDVSMRHLNMRFVSECPYVSCILTGPANEAELNTNIREVSTPLPEDVWKEALLRIAELDAS